MSQLSQNSAQRAHFLCIKPCSSVVHVWPGKLVFSSRGETLFSCFHILHSGTLVWYLVLYENEATKVSLGFWILCVKSRTNSIYHLHCDCFVSYYVLGKPLYVLRFVFGPLVNSAGPEYEFWLICTSCIIADSWNMWVWSVGETSPKLRNLKEAIHYYLKHLRNYLKLTESPNYEHIRIHT